MTNAEHHEYLCGILNKLVPVLDCDELETLARCAGIRIDEFYDSPSKAFTYLAKPQQEYQTPF
jgi:hypothetical protein